MKRILLASALFLLLAACSHSGEVPETSNRPPHPASNADAFVLIEEYADFQCPACRAAHENIAKPLLLRFGSEVRYEFRHFPLRTIHRYALDAAEASECAADQGKFWEFVDLAFEQQEKLSRETLTTWGEKLSLDAAAYERCRVGHSKKDVVLSDYEAGRERGIGGTPTFFLNGLQVRSTLEDLSAAIEQAVTGMKARL